MRLIEWTASGVAAAAAAIPIDEEYLISSSVYEEVPYQQPEDLILFNK